MTYNPGAPQITARGSHDGTISLVCGIVGLFVFGIILGPIAIVYSRKAARDGGGGGKATAGLVLGIIAVVSWVLVIATRGVYY